MTEPDIHTDPFTQVYDGLWETLEAERDFTDLVRIGNRISFAGPEARPRKAELGYGDMPEVEIVPIGGEAQPWSTSTTLMAVERFEIRSVTGDQRIHEILNPLRWAILRALVARPRLGLPSWVEDARIVAVETAQFEDVEGSPRQEPPGWFLTVRIEVRIMLGRDAALSGETGT